MDKLLIIYYHEIVPAGRGYSYQKIEEARFEQQMKYLSENHYHTLLFSELTRNLPERAVIVSFDDAFSSVYDSAAPIMERYGIKGNIYLPTEYIGSSDQYMTWDMVQDLQRRGSWDFAAHTHRHTDIRSLTEESAREDLKESERLFMEHLGFKPDVFCVPYGKYDRSSIKMVRRLGGYRYLLGSFYGFCSLQNADRKVLPRIGISNDDSMDVFIAKLAGKMNWKGPLQRMRLTAENLKGQRVESDKAKEV